MRPGEIVTASGPVPVSTAARRRRVTMRNAGRLPVYIGSHFGLARLSESLELDRSGLEGARPDLPAGATVRIEAGATVELDVIWD